MLLQGGKQFPGNQMKDHDVRYGRQAAGDGILDKLNHIGGVEHGSSLL